jgi:hypothetical protein
LLRIKKGECKERKEGKAKIKARGMKKKWALLIEAMNFVRAVRETPLP